MPLRKINKANRVKLVTWMRKGAPLSEGVSLYASIAGHNIRLGKALLAKPEAYKNEMFLDVCEMLGISLAKFESIKNQNNAKKKNEPTRTRKVVREVRTENRPAKKTPSFREDWPFLSKPECPPELKVLAADKITCWKRYTENHKKLFDCSSMEECSTIAHEIVKDYKENRQIWEELNHYKEHKNILGVHSVFAHFKRFKKFRGMNAFELIKEHERVKHRIWRIENEIKKGDKPHLLAKREKSLYDTRAEFAELDRMVNMHG
jgi:hypothetical protein